MLEIRIAGCEILGRPRDMSQVKGVFVGPGGFQGWKGMSNTRREALARAVQHGEHDVPVYLGSRVVTIDGHVLAGSDYVLNHLTERVTGLLGIGRTNVSVSMEGNERHALGRVTLAACEDAGSSGRLRRANFQLQLVFADPRKYGNVNVFPGDTLNPKDPTATATSIPVFHWGNFPAYPVIEIPNAPAGYTITSPGGTYTVAGATAGGTHTVDLRRGRVFRDGVEMLNVGHGNLWAVPSGMPWVHTLSVAGRVRIPNTYI